MPAGKLGPEALPLLRRLEAGMDRAFVGAAAFALRRPWTILAGAGLLCLLTVLSALGMRFHAEVTDLVPASTVGAFQRLEEVFGAGESAFLLVRASRPAPGELEEIARGVAADLAAQPLVRSVSFGWSDLAEKMLAPDFLALAPLFAPPEEAESLRRLLTPAGVAAQVRKQSLQLGLLGLGEAERWVERDPLELRRFLFSRLQAMKGGFRSQAGSLHFLSEDGRRILIRIDGAVRSSDIPSVKLIVASIRSAAARAIDRARQGADPPVELETGLTGGYAYAFETEATVRSDLTWNNIGSFVLLLALVALSYRSLALVLPSLAALAIGMIVGFGLFSLLRREIVTLAFVSGAALAGLGIDYVIYVTLRSFSDPRGLSTASVLSAVESTGRAILFAALTTAAAFFSFPLTGERFLSDVGLLSGVGILACGAAAIVLLPALLAPWARAGDRRGPALPEKPLPPPRDFGAAWLTRLALGRPRSVLAASILSGVASIIFLSVRPPAPEKDLRRIHPADSDAVRTQEEIAETFGGAESPVLLLVEGGSVSPPAGKGAPDAVDVETEAVEACARLEAPLRALRERGIISAWSSPAGLVPPAAEQRRAREILLAADPDALAAAFRAALEAEGFDPAVFERAEETFRASLRPPELITPGLLRRLGLASEVRKLIGEKGGRGFALVAAHPAKLLWHSEDQERVLEELEGALASAGVRGQVAGLQVLSAKGAWALMGEFLKVSAFAAAAVVALVIFCFRGWVGCALALLPVVLGTLWMGVACDLLGVRLNFMNVGVLPMVLGTGVDIGIHMAHQYLSEPGVDLRTLSERTGSSVMLASLTTLASFGTMVYSKNPGLTSVGAMSTIGTTTCLLASLLTVPSALALHARRARRRAQDEI